MKRLFLSFLVCVLFTGSTFAAMSDLEFIELCKSGSLQEINNAIKSGANVNARDENGITPLMAAVWNGKNTGVINSLINASADVNAKNAAGVTPLMYAKRKKYDSEVVSILLNNGAYPETDNSLPDEPKFTQERAWDQIPWTVPPEDKMEFAKRIYSTMKDALSSRRNAYLRYGEPLRIQKAWQPSILFKEVPFPGDWGENIVLTNGKRGIFWWSKWHTFGISTYGSKVLGAWILDSGYGYNGSKISMEDFWKWYDERILLFNHFFKQKPVHDDEMAVWVLNKQYLFILVPNIGVVKGGSGDLEKNSQSYNPLEWLMQPFALFEWVNWALGNRPTDKNLLYYLVRMSEVPDEVTLNQVIHALRTPLYPGSLDDALAVGATELAEKAQMRRKLEKQK